MEIGSSLPPIGLYDTEKKKVELSDFKGKNLVILFFPFAFSSVCTAEMCSMRDDITTYNELDAEVVGISVDSLYTLKKFKSEEKINFSLLSDFNKEASKAFGALFETFPSFEMRGVSKRAAFVADKEGVVRYKEVCASPRELPDFGAIQKTLLSLN